MESTEEATRRERLHELDAVLDALERLNLEEASELPDALREKLGNLGVQAGARADFSALIERVWELQERFLQPGPADGGPTPLLRRSSFPDF